MVEFSRNLQIVDASLDAMRLGIMRDHYLIQIEYTAGTTNLVEDVFRKSNDAVTRFINREDIRILKFHCLPESEFFKFASKRKRSKVITSSNEKNKATLARLALSSQTTSEIVSSSPAVLYSTPTHARPFATVDAEASILHVSEYMYELFLKLFFAGIRCECSVKLT